MKVFKFLATVVLLFVASSHLTLPAEAASDQPVDASADSVPTRERYFWSSPGQHGDPGAARYGYSRRSWAATLLRPTAFKKPRCLL